MTRLAHAVARGSSRGRRSVRELAVCALMAGVGCTSPSERAPTPPPRHAPAPTHFLDEWVSLPSGRCRLVAAERAYAAQRAGEGQVPEDHFYVTTRWECEDERGAALPVRKVLPGGDAVAWLDDQHVVRPRASRPLRIQRRSDQLSFEVPELRDGLMRPRKYDARSGEPSGARERGHARLLIATPTGQLAIAPWPRMHDATLDLLLDQLAKTLATDAPFEALTESGEAHASLELASELYRRAAALLHPQLLVVRRVVEREGQPRITLGFEGTSGPRLASSLELELEVALAGGRGTILRLLDPEARRAQIACAEATAGLQARVEAAARAARSPDVHCNVVSTLLPGRCGEVAPPLLTQALELGTRCGASGALELDVADRAPLPADFAVQLRRGRAARSLDRAPRYTLAIDREGAVSFRGEHWVSARGPSEGRTSRRLLAALYGQLTRIGWFTRPAPRERCPDDAYGDLIRVRAGRRERAVRNRDGCRGGFSERELDTLRRAIERIAGVEAWTAPHSNFAARDDQIWVVAAE